ncbi:XRCC4-like factor-domain-containing protein [Elsinoe ampelina]|uniref:Non-homologous end-joining factor 1 n=1 Tax=Elsinoe ampelina TaxID=302913 RepID=A0A6A6G7Y5_9PEZI|nr:XRCC4-like factor-domain-containing protein [Elsinoe ampelina]
MAYSSSWRPLSATGPTDGFLIKYAFEVTGYQVFLTDLREVWEERLDRDAILTRAGDTHCPIDASEDESQQKILLEKLAKAIRGEGGATVSFHRRGRDDAVILDLQAPLPSPLPELKWQCTLLPKGPESLLDNVTSGLIQQLHRRNQDVADLHDVISSKDNIIKKLLDRLESMNIDLTTVFPGISNLRLSSKTSQRDQIARHVKGLQPFEQESWHTPQHDIQDCASLAALLATTDGHAASSVRKLLDQIGSPNASFSNGQVRTSPETNHKSGRGTGHGDGDATASETDDDEFQVQKLPTTASDDQAGPVRSQIHQSSEPVECKRSSWPAKARLSDSAQPERKPKARIGIIGRKAANDQATHVESAISTPAEEKADDGLPVSDAPVATKKPKLGTIGGRRNKTSQASVPTSITPTLDAGAASVSEIPAARRIQSPTPPAQENRGRTMTAAEPEAPAQRETSEERANRRREELKRSIESKPVGGIKKKRKF